MVSDLNGCLCLCQDVFCTRLISRAWVKPTHLSSPCISFVWFHVSFVDLSRLQEPHPCWISFQWWVHKCQPGSRGSSLSWYFLVLIICSYCSRLTTRHYEKWSGRHSHQCERTGRGPAEKRKQRELLVCFYPDEEDQTIYWIGFLTSMKSFLWLEVCRTIGRLWPDIWSQFCQTKFD